jgi:hypothetical protein
MYVKKNCTVNLQFTNWENVSKLLSNFTNLPPWTWANYTLYWIEVGPNHQWRFAWKQVLLDVLFVHLDVVVLFKLLKKLMNLWTVRYIQFFFKTHLFKFHKKLRYLGIESKYFSDFFVFFRWWIWYWLWRKNALSISNSKPEKKLVTYKSTHTNLLLWAWANYIANICHYHYSYMVEDINLLMMKNHTYMNIYDDKQKQYKIFNFTIIMS